MSNYDQKGSETNEAMTTKAMHYPAGCLILGKRRATTIKCTHTLTHINAQQKGLNKAT